MSNFKIQHFLTIALIALTALTLWSGCSSLGNKNPLDPENPIFKNSTPIEIQSTQISATRLSLTIQSDQPTRSQITLSTASSSLPLTQTQTQTQTTPAFSKSSSLIFTGLKPLTPYTISAEGRDEQGHFYKASDLTLKTPDYFSILLNGSTPTPSNPISSPTEELASSTESSSPTTVTASSEILSTLSSLSDMKFSPNGESLFLVDQGSHQIKTLNLTTLKTAIFAGTGSSGFQNGPVASAAFNNPTKIQLALDGALWVLDTKNHALRKIQNGMVTTILGNGTPGFSDSDLLGPCLNSPLDFLLLPNNDIILADTANQRIRKLSGGTLTTLVGNGSFGFSLDASAQQSLGYPSALLQTNEGLIFFELFHTLVKRLNTNGSISHLAGHRITTDSRSTQLTNQSGSAFEISYGEITSFSGALNGRILLIDKSNGLVRELDPNLNDSVFLGDPSNQAEGEVKLVEGQTLEVIDSEIGTYGGIRSILFTTKGDLLVGLKKAVLKVFLVE